MDIRRLRRLPQIHPVSSLICENLQNLRIITNLSNRSIGLWLLDLMPMGCRWAKSSRFLRSSGQAAARQYIRTTNAAANGRQGAATKASLENGRREMSYHIGWPSFKCEKRTPAGKKGSGGKGSKLFVGRFAMLDETSLP